MSFITTLLSFLKSDQLLESPITSSTYDFAVVRSPVLDDALGFSATLSSFVQQTLFAMFVLFIIIAAACFCTPLKVLSSILDLAAASCSSADVLPSPKQECIDRSDYLPLSVATPGQVQPRKVLRKPLRQSSSTPFAVTFGLSKPIPVPSSAFITSSFPTSSTSFLSTPSCSSSGIDDIMSSLSISRPDVDSVVDALAKLSISRPDVEPVISSFGSMSINSSAFDTLSTKSTSANSKASRPLVATQKVREFTTSIFEPPSNIDTTFGSLSITSCLKSCMKSGLPRLPKKVHFDHPTMTVADVRFHDAEKWDPLPGCEEEAARLVEKLSTWDTWRSVRQSTSCAPHQRSPREYYLLDNGNYIMERVDGAYIDPSKSGTWVDANYGDNGGHLRRANIHKNEFWCCGEGSNPAVWEKHHISLRVRRGVVPRRQPKNYT